MNQKFTHLPQFSKAETASPRDWQPGETQIFIKNDQGEIDQVMRISAKENEDSVEIEYSLPEKPFSGFTY
jgi:hypothetical protein